MGICRTEKVVPVVLRDCRQTPAQVCLQDSSSSSNPASLRSDEGVSGHWRNPPKIQKRETACEIFRRGWKSSQKISKIQKCQHPQTFLMTQIRNILRKWHPRSTVFILTSQKKRNCEVCRRTKITRAPCRRRTGEPVPRAEKSGDLVTTDHKVLN